MSAKIYETSKLFKVLEYLLTKSRLLRIHSIFMFIFLSFAFWSQLWHPNDPEISAVLIFGVIEVMVSTLECIFGISVLMMFLLLWLVIYSATLEYKYESVFYVFGEFNRKESEDLFFHVINTPEKYRINNFFFNREVKIIKKKHPEYFI